ncbi:hypothetical protein Adt_32118 [Abeliophyllum distichum]|uniref:Uncharacterized protein n=1 Tax=Abeliophyllum distichum TaxID=126358 RepID=A0ABD1RG13_9LAMI
MIYPRGTTEPKKSVASSAQTVAGKDSSNPFMAMDLPKVQQTQGTVDFPTNQTQQYNSEQTQIWDTLGQPIGKFDYLVKYSPASPDNLSSPQNCDSQTSPLSKGKEILQDSQDPEDDIISINKLLSQIQKLQETSKDYKGTSKWKKKIVKKKKKNDDGKEKFEEVINKALHRVFPKKEKSQANEIQECPQKTKPEESSLEDNDDRDDE